MLKTVKKIFRNWQQDDKGIAILFTLGILSLLLILAMSFATDAIIERKAAYNNNTRTQAKWLAKSALNRAIAAMQFYIAYPQSSTDKMTAPLTFDHIVSGSEVSTSTDTNCNATTSYSDLIKSTSPQTSRLFTVDSDRYCEEFPDYTNGTNDRVKWQYVYNPTNSAIIGRFAYATFVDTGRIDLAASVDSCVNTSISESRDDNSTATKPRPGVDISEIALYGLNSAYTLSSANLVKLSAKSSDVTGGMLADSGKRWLSMEQVLSYGVLNFMPSSASDYATKLKRGYFYSLSNIYNQPDPEAYWVDLNFNNKLDMTTVGGSASYELYHRFNIARNDWTSLTSPFCVSYGTTGHNGADVVNHLLCVNDTTFTDCQPQKFNTTYTGHSGIQFLRKIGNQTGTFSNMTALRKQIAANFINYCSPLSTPVVSDVNPSNWSYSNRPTYTGNKSTFYLNEVWAKTTTDVIVAGTGTFDSGNGGKEILKYTINPVVEIGSEIIDIYGNSNKSSRKVTLYGKSTIQVSYPSLPLPTTKSYDVFWGVTPTAAQTADGATSNPLTITFTTASGTLRNDVLAYTFTDVPIAKKLVYPTSLWGDIITSYDVTVQVTYSELSCAVLEDSSGQVDFAYVNKNVSPSSGAGKLSNTIYSGHNGQTGTDGVILGAMTEDPRQNLNPGDWNPSVYVSGGTEYYYYNGSYGSDSFGTPGATNRLHDSTGYPLVAPNTVNNSPIYSNTPPTPPAPPPGYDVETATDIKATSSASLSNTISTAYIRHGPMQSPWELGAIHRGVKWRTINLQGFTKLDKVAGGVGHHNYVFDSTDLDDSTGGCAYSAGSGAGGDAGILDQIKMSDATSAYGKISINGQAVDVYRALFYNVVLNTDYTAPGILTGSKVQDQTSFWTTNNTIKTYLTSTVQNTTYLQRGALATDLYHDFTPTTKAQGDALIGKVINLTQANIPSSEIRIMVIAQTIRDIGGTSTSPIRVTKARGDGTTGTVYKDCQISVFDYDSASKTYFDEITGEQKLYAIVSRDPVTNKFKIKKMEFINE